jgi:hypothetical protein
VHSYGSNELHRYHIGDKKWHKLDSSTDVTGVVPGVRRLMGFTAHCASLWVTFGRGTRNRAAGAPAAVPDDNMCGDAFRFEISTRRWSTLSSVSTARFELSLTALGSMLFAFGGRRSVYDSADKGSGEMLTLDVGDPVNVWATLGSQGDIPAPRENAGLATVGGKLVLFGGRGWDFFNDIHLLRPSTSTWTKVAAFTGQAPSGRRSFGNLSSVALASSLEARVAGRTINYFALRWRRSLMKLALVSRPAQPPPRPTVNRHLPQQANCQHPHLLAPRPRPPRPRPRQQTSCQHSQLLTTRPHPPW